MSETKSVHDWTKDWEALQRQYWNAWTDLTRNQAGKTPDISTPWHEGLEQWSRMFGTAGKQSEAAERLLASAKSYLSLMQSMLSFVAGKDPSVLTLPSWLEAMRGGLNLPGFDPAKFGGMPGFDPTRFGAMPGFDPAAFASMPGLDASLLNNPVAKALREISGQGIKGFEQLATGALPLLQQFQKEGMSWLHVPAFGYAREHQEHYQKMVIAFADFQEALKQYNALILKSSQRSFEILELKLAERSEPGRQIDSVRALYDLWVDAAEEAYAEIALSDEFRKVYGDVVNAQMRVRQQLQQEVERIGADLGMPTRSELNSVHKRLHDLRRELRDSQERAAAADGRDAEIAAMRAEIDDLRRLVENSEPAAASPRPSAAPAAAKAGARPRRARARLKRAAKRAHVATKTTAGAVPTSAAAKRSTVRKAPAKPVAAKAASKPVAANPVAVKRAAAKSAAKPAARTPAATEPVAAKSAAAKAAPAKRAPGASRRAAPRTSAAAPSRSTEKKSAAAPASFGDAIAAMRSELSGATGRKKSAAARLSLPSRKSAGAVRSRRSKQ